VIGVEETDLRQLAMAVRAILNSLIPDPAEASRIDVEIARALALPQGEGKSALRAVLSSHPALRAWMREQGVSGGTSWRLLPEPPAPDESEPVTRYGNGESEPARIYEGAESAPGDESADQGLDLQDGPEPPPPPTPHVGDGSESGPGLLGDDDDDVDEIGAPPEEVAEQPDQRFFVAELEDHPMDQPLRTGEQYTIAFSVGTPPPSAIATTPFGDEILAAAWKDVEELDLTVQLDSDDFEILGDSTRPLRVPRTGKSRGKARFDITPRHDGECLLVASVHYKGNFVQQMEVRILVGGRGRASVEVSGRGRAPDSAATLEPRDISIVLAPAPAGGFTCTVMGSVAKWTVLPITDAELAAAVDSVRRAMMSVIQTEHAGKFVFQSSIDIPDAARDTALHTLARAGALLFQRLFFHPHAGADARNIGEWLRDQAMDPDGLLKVLVAADQAPLPWPLLYLGEASEGSSLDWNYFLGMRHIVDQLPLQPNLNTRGNQIPSEPKLAVSVNVNAFIDPSMGITLVAEHQKRWNDTAEGRPGLALVSRSTKSEVVRALADGHTADQVIYFYCHATAGLQKYGDPIDAEIIMGKNDRASLADLNLDAPTTVQLAGNPLVFINACESADLSPLFYNGFVPYFMAKGARGVIGTECKTPVLFAIEWANAFFDRFLDGGRVGEIVLALRQDFLRAHGNPLGLIYAVHCSADTRIAPALARAQQLLGRGDPQRRLGSAVDIDPSLRRRFPCRCVTSMRPILITTSCCSTATVTNAGNRTGTC
jgi:hypothetical protein